MYGVLFRIIVLASCIFRKCQLGKLGLALLSKTQGNLVSWKEHWLRSQDTGPRVSHPPLRGFPASLLHPRGLVISKAPCSPVLVQKIREADWITQTALGQRVTFGKARGFPMVMKVDQNSCFLLSLSLVTSKVTSSRIWAQSATMTSHEELQVVLLPLSISNLFCF